MFELYHMSTIFDEIFNSPNFCGFLEPLFLLSFLTFFLPILLMANIFALLMPLSSFTLEVPLNQGGIALVCTFPMLLAFSLRFKHLRPVHLNIINKCRRTHCVLRHVMFYILCYYLPPFLGHSALFFDWDLLYDR